MAEQTIINMEVDGVVDDQSKQGETLMPTDSCCDHDQVVVSYECPTDASANNAIAAASAAGEDKKLQYALRSNPKRSRRFFDPDYALELVSPLAPSSTVTTTTISSNITAVTATLAPPAAAAATATSTAANAPVKKTKSLLCEKARACTECGKQFPSWKALFGHMRCHPEREWRGIQPPNSLLIARDKPCIRGGNEANSTTSQLQHIAVAKATGAATAAATMCPSLWEYESENSRALAHADDYVEESDTESIEAAYMNGRDQESPKMHDWMRGKRSKRSLQDVVSCQSGTQPEDVMDERDMVDCLVMLASAAKSKAEERDSEQAELAWERHSRPPLAAETREKMKEKKSYGCVQKSILFLARDGKVEKWEEDHKKGSWERKSKFECSTCKKTFRSHQALGGHRASHKKVKGCFARNNTTEEVALQEATEMNYTMTMMMEQQEEGPDAAAKKIAEEEEEPALEEMSEGQFLQCSITCNEMLEEDQCDSATAMENKKLKHQTSSCSSSSSVMAATEAAGTMLMHHNFYHHHQQQPKIHQCTICHRVFSTGQALGGHKRCHWGGSATPESSKKASAQAWMNVSVVTEKASEQVSEHSRKGRQEFPSCNDTKGGHACAQDWLGKYAWSDNGLDLNKMGLGKRCCDDNNGDDGCGGGVPAQKGWFEAFSTHSELRDMLVGRKETGSLDAGDEGNFESCVSEKGCESNIYIHHQASCYDSGDVSTDAREQPLVLCNAAPLRDEMLDLNLPAPAEDAEDGACSATALRPADVAHHQHHEKEPSRLIPPPNSALAPAAPSLDLPPLPTGFEKKGNRLDLKL